MNSPAFCFSLATGFKHSLVSRVSTWKQHINVHRSSKKCQRQICMAKDKLSSSSRSLTSEKQTLPSLQYASCVPPSAALIEDATAQEMLSHIQYTPVITKLSPSIIHTSHVVSADKGADGPLLLFLHGFDSNLLEYRYIFSSLSNEPVECHFVDILGWGLTERPENPDFTYGPEAIRLHLEGYLDRFATRDRSIVLIGASIGGAVAIDYLLRSQRQIDALILIDAQAFTDKKKTRVSGIRRIAEIGANILRSKWLRKMAVDLAYYSKSFKNEDTIRIGSLHCQSPRWKESTVSFVQGEGFCLSGKVSHICVPTLVLWGRQDRVLPRGDAQKFQEAIPHCRLEYIEDCGHIPHVEKPLTVSKVILEFVENLNLPSKPLHS